MENHLPRNTKVLSMKISCCERCPIVLKRKILKMPGVDSVAIDTADNLVYVVGEIDATTLVNNVAKLGKSVQLLSPDKQPRNHDEKSHNHHKRNEGGGKNFEAPEKGKPHKNCCCEDGRHNTQKKVEKEKKEEHKCEAYVPPAVDARICRDFYCKIHPRGRLIVDRVPAESTSTFFGMGGLPFYSGYSPYDGGSYQYPRGHGGWYGQEPPQFGYGQPPRKLPQHPFIFQ